MWNSVRIVVKVVFTVLFFFKSKKKYYKFWAFFGLFSAIFYLLDPDPQSASSMRIRSHMHRYTL